MTLSPYSAITLLRRADEEKARALYADVIAALEQHVTDVGVEWCGNELHITVPLTDDQYVSIAGRHSLPWHDDRGELGGWTAVHVDDAHGTARAVYDTATPDGEPSGDMSLEPLAAEVGSYVNGWRAEHA